MDYTDIEVLKAELARLTDENRNLKEENDKFKVTIGEDSVFQRLNSYDISGDVKKKGNITYLPWSKAWTIIKTFYPDAILTINKTEDGRIYHTDGKTAWVEVSITIKGQTETETLAVMDFKNTSIPLERVTSTDVGKSIKRCLVKCAAMHGLGLSLWTGEELSSAARQKKEQDLDDVKQKILGIISAKMESGVPRETIFKTLVDLTGEKNPNSIKDLATANKVAEAIKKLGGKAKC